MNTTCVSELTPESECISFGDGYTTVGKVIHVIDGDTLTILFFSDECARIPLRHRVRLYGIDAPELRPRISIDPESRKDIIRRGELARDFLRDRVTDRVVRLDCHGVDSFGRILGTITCEGEDLNDTMVRMGHAVKWDPTRK